MPLSRSCTRRHPVLLFSCFSLNLCGWSQRIIVHVGLSVEYSNIEKKLGCAVIPGHPLLIVCPMCVGVGVQRREPKITAPSLSVELGCLIEVVVESIRIHCCGGILGPRTSISS